MTRVARPKKTPRSKSSSTSLRDAVARRLGNDLVRRLLEELRSDARAARRTWARLSGAERQVVASSCGEPFVKAFDQPLPKDPGGFEFVERRISRPPERLRAQGYCLLGHRLTGNPAYDVEGWVHPSGHMVERDVSGLPAAAITTQRDEDEGEDGDGVTIETPQQNVRVMNLPEDPKKLLRVAEIGNENLATYCADNPYDVFEGEDARVLQEHVDEYIAKVKDIRWKIDSALAKLQRLRDGQEKVPPGYTLSGDFWRKVDAAKNTYEGRKRQCCTVISESCDPGTPQPQP
jgi:hypothetical protein